MKKCTRITTVAILTMAVFLSMTTAAFAGSNRGTQNGYTYRKSLAGITVIKHWTTTTFTYTGAALVNEKGLTQSWWTAPLNYDKSSGAGWDWYTAKTGGTGRSNQWVVFVFGVPTPWGPIGSSLKDGHTANVSYNGGSAMNSY